MTTQTPDAVREAIIKYTQHYVGCAVYGSWADGEPKCSCGLDEARAALAALDSRAGDDLTPRERIARVVAWEHFGIAWHHMEKQSHANVLAMVDRMLDSHAGDAGEGFGAVLERWDSVIPLSHDERAKLIAELTAATPAPAVDAEEGDDEGPCTDCGDTGITIQTERACSCDAGHQYRAPAVDAVPAGEVDALRVDWNRRELADAYDMVEGMRQQIAQPAESPLNQSLLTVMDALEAADVEWSGITKTDRSSEA